MLLNGCLSATSGVANEWLIKVQDPKAPLMLKNAQIYFFGVLVGVSSWRSPARGGLKGFDSKLACFIVLLNAATRRERPVSAAYLWGCFSFSHSMRVRALMCRRQSARVRICGERIEVRATHTRACARARRVCRARTR